MRWEVPIEKNTVNRTIVNVVISTFALQCGCYFIIWKIIFLFKREEAVMDDLKSNLEGIFSYLNSHKLNLKEENNSAVTEIDNLATSELVKNENFGDHIAGM